MPTFRYVRQYKIFFIIGPIILIIQILLGYISLNISGIGLNSSNKFDLNHKRKFKSLNITQSTDDDGMINTKYKKLEKQQKFNLNLNELQFIPECLINTKEAISAINRAKSQDCKKYIANVTCLIQSGEFYPSYINSECKQINSTSGNQLGCYKDNKEFRLLSGYYITFKDSNTPKKCLKLCLQSGFPYAGVQYSYECFCGTNSPVLSLKLPDSSCNMKCSGDPKQTCGGIFTMNIYETGISKFTPDIPNLSNSKENNVKIAFLLTLNGRALRQVYRLIKALYSTNNVFYIHVDARQEYLFRELLKLEDKFDNIKLAQKRYSTIWGGASLLTMLLESMKDLLSSKWKWDFVINLSESDFPVKTIDKLGNFLTNHKGKNFVKSHGQETQRFIRKQGLDKTFVECDTHMWRIGDRELPEGIHIDGGSDWVTLSRDFVEYIVNNSNETFLKDLLIYFQHTLLPAESFFHIVLRNSKFCLTYINNNLHLTNWKRRLGCKCQYKHIVDWCGCSPNDFKINDFPRLQGTENKPIFFARKFEPIINQAIILQLENWLYGPYTADYLNLNSYWQNIYHFKDNSKTDIATKIISESLLRLIERLLDIKSIKLREIINFYENDIYKGFLLKYLANYNNENFEFESIIRLTKTRETIKNSYLAERITDLSVSTDYDLKEQISRNFPKFMDSTSEPILIFQFLGKKLIENHSYNLSILWIDPCENLYDFSEIHIEDSQSNATFHTKLNKQNLSLRPGIWTVKILGKINIIAQLTFLIVPSNNYKFDNNDKIKKLIYPKEWQQYFNLNNQNKKIDYGCKINKNLNITINLFDWIDSFVSKFYLIDGTCIVKNNNKFENCENIQWSSYAPDPKSDIYSLLN